MRREHLVIFNYLALIDFSTILSQASERLLNFHLGNLEYACATTLDHVSALSWDQNESFPQFQGNHTLLTHGYETILQRLAEGLDIHLGAEVFEQIQFSLAQFDI